MIRRAKVRSLAKINLDLRVLHKRPDGYHELRTVFQTVSLSDVLEIEFKTARQSSVETRVIFRGEELDIPDNLTNRAAKAILHTLKIKAHIRMTLHKEIPMGGGLGGGSSNAAAVLLTLPVLAGRVVASEKLADIGTQLGSDVPFFLQGGTALAVGRGTEMYPLPEVKPEPVIIVDPNLHVSTANAYQKLAKKLTSPDTSRKINLFQRYVETLAGTGSAAAAGSASMNDFEPAVFSAFPQLKALHGKLRSYSPVSCSSVRMTGSGSALFAIFGSEAERSRAQADLDKVRMFEQCLRIEATLVSRKQYQKLWRKQLAEHLRPSDSIWPPQSRYAR